MALKAAQVSLWGLMGTESTPHLIVLLYTVHIQEMPQVLV